MNEEGPDCAVKGCDGEAEYASTTEFAGWRIVLWNCEVHFDLIFGDGECPHSKVLMRPVGRNQTGWCFTCCRWVKREFDRYPWQVDPDGGWYD